MSRKVIPVLILALALAVSPALLAQETSDVYAGRWAETQTRNIPAGSVNDPGSHLTYILDTGVNARALLNDVSLDSSVGSVLGDLQSVLDVNSDGQLDNGAIMQNFVSITNTHPTMAVTIHFRYYNDNCDDILDFLVILTCNDTLMFDPFNFIVPFSGGENTRDRIFGPQRPGRVLVPITTKEYGSGRFILTAAASGAKRNHALANTWAEILFPNETPGSLNNECNITRTGTTLPTDPSREDVLRGAVRNVGLDPGVVANNLHIFNAFQISFDFLIGMQTVAVPKAFIRDAPSDQDQFLAYGMAAWTRPSVDRNWDGNGDGDGPGVPPGHILLGSERGWSAGNNTLVTDIPANNYYLRNEVHGGGIEGLLGLRAEHGGRSTYGALGTQGFHIVQPDNMVFHFLSVADDYNGSNNGVFFGIRDKSANISAAATRYIMQIYDNDENILTYTAPPVVPISPLPPQPVVVKLKMTCICLRTFLTEAILPATNVDDLTIQDMVDIFGSSVLDGEGDFRGLLNPLPPDVSGGWIRFVRDNTLGVSLTGAEAAAVGLPLWDPFLTHQYPLGGTVTFDVDGQSDNTLTMGPSFLTGAQQIVKYGGLGAGWWLGSAASDPRISDAGREILD